MRQISSCMTASSGSCSESDESKSCLRVLVEDAMWGVTSGVAAFKGKRDYQPVKCPWMLTVTLTPKLTSKRDASISRLSCSDKKPQCEHTWFQPVLFATGLCDRKAHGFKLDLDSLIGQEQLQELPTPHALCLVLKQQHQGIPHQSGWVFRGHAGCA